jgi:hypothetical protein
VEKKMFIEYRINEADITADETCWAGIPEWYRSPTTGKKFDYVISFYINVLYYANYKMMAEMAVYNGYNEDAAEFTRVANELQKSLRENLWRDEKGRYIAGIAYNEDGYEDLDLKWENIGFDYIWGLTLPDDQHLPFNQDTKNGCLEAAYKAEAWAITNFGIAELATDYKPRREELVDRLIKDACVADHCYTKGKSTWYFYPYCLPEGENNQNLPQIFAISPAIKALCLTVQRN